MTREVAHEGRIVLSPVAFPGGTATRLALEAWRELPEVVARLSRFYDAVTAEWLR